MRKDLAHNKKVPMDSHLIFGKNPVLEVIGNEKVQINKIYLSENFSDLKTKQKVISHAKEKKIPFYIVPYKKLNSLSSNQNHQGVILSISPVKYLSVNEIINNALKTNSKIILVAHEIQDAHNLGALIRTFVAAGGKGVILTGRSSMGITATATKTSAGALFQTEFARATNCINVLNQLKDSGFWIIGTDISSNAESVYKVDFPDQIAIVVGNEHEGLGDLIKKNCDFLVRIPLNHKIESLNVSVAFGIVLFEILRQKKC